jgi:hypothetical protein
MGHAVGGRRSSRPSALVFGAGGGGWGTRWAVVGRRDPPHSFLEQEGVDGARGGPSSVVKTLRARFEPESGRVDGARRGSFWVVKALGERKGRAREVGLVTRPSRVYLRDRGDGDGMGVVGDTSPTRRRRRRWGCDAASLVRGGGARR